MQNISYLKAGLSCLPIVGPVVGLYNEYKMRGEISALRITGLASGEFKANLPELSEKGYRYSVCAVIGNVLTVAVEVGFIALGILTGLSAIATVGLFAGLAFMHTEDALTYSYGNIALRRPFIPFGQPLRLLNQIPS